MRGWKFPWPLVNFGPKPNTTVAHLKWWPQPVMQISRVGGLGLDNSEDPAMDLTLPLIFYKREIPNFILFFSFLSLLSDTSKRSLFFLSNDLQPSSDSSRVRDITAADFNGLMKSVSSGAHCVLSTSARNGTSNRGSVLWTAWRLL